MGKTVATRIVRIGNSRGVRIPKALLQQLDLDDEVTMSIQGSQLVIRSKRHPPREGWEEQFRLAHARGDAPWQDETDWQWPEPSSAHPAARSKRR